MPDEIRLLTLDERVYFALMFCPEIEELREICQPSVASALQDSDKVHRINVLLSAHGVPVLSTELEDEQIEALRTGQPPAHHRPKIKIYSKGVLGDRDGERLNELFNSGKFVQIGDTTPRPMSTWCLEVGPEDQKDLEEIHSRWVKSRICVLVETIDGAFWVTPETTKPGSNTQNYTVVNSSSAHVPNRSPVLRGTVVNSDHKRGGNWRDALDEMILRKPELGFVHLILNHYLQPAHVQLLHHAQLGSKVLLLIYQGVLYRVVGISSSGMLLLTRKLTQGLVYETTVPFLDVMRHPSTVWKQKDE